MDQFTEMCQSAARKGGEILLESRDSFSVSEKNPNDLVTDADIASQKAIEELIRSEFPEHGFLGEEATATGQENQAAVSGFRWIVDPLDGTVNYVHGLQSYSVSIALEEDGELVCGAVFDPVMNEMFLAAKDQPATLNGKPIQPSSRQQLADSLVVVSLPARTRRGSFELEQMLNLMEGARSIRRLGSAALNLCYVADGRLDVYVASSVKAWDVAAGALILQRAGGVIRQQDDRALNLDDPKLIAASTEKLWRQVYLQVQV